MNHDPPDLPVEVSSSHAADAPGKAHSLLASSIADELAELESRGLRRTLREVNGPAGARIRLNGRELICFCSNNYLDLANHPAVVSAVAEAVQRWGWGAGASRLVAGHMSPHQQLEDHLAAFKGHEAALVCSTGYQANLAVLRALAGAGDAIFLDKLNHASLIDAARGSGAVLRVYPHGDLDKLERLLQRSAGYRRRIIATDGLFSMDGDLADLPGLAALKARYDALLVVDEAHATGVLGEYGRGAAELAGVEHAVDVSVGTLSKALGGIGGFVTASRTIIDWLINRAGPFIYTTALPAAACAGALAALAIVRAEPGRRKHLLVLADRLRRGLHAAGLDTGRSISPIVPVRVGDAGKAVRMSAMLEERGYWIPAIRPPTVPAGTARLRISLCAAHTPADVDGLIAVLQACRSDLDHPAWG